MTIDTAITWLNTDDYESKGFAQATGVAIETMCKYQMIEQIVDEWTRDLTAVHAMIKIKEVIEDVKTDT